MGMLSEALILSSAIACVQSYLSPFLEPALMYMVAMALVLDLSVRIQVLLLRLLGLGCLSFRVIFLIPQLKCC